MKTCRVCGEQKPLAEFYVHAQMADGHLKVCKRCVRDRVREKRAENVEHFRAYDRARMQDPERRKAHIAGRMRHAHRHPDRAKARWMVFDAIRRGKMTRQPCEVCGAARSEAHHDDYSQPLAVRWLCRPHHHEVHRRLSAQLRQAS